LQQELRLPLITFPLIFVQGSYIGGFDQLQEAVDSGRFEELIAEVSKPFPSGARLLADPLHLLIGPRGQPWYCFQLHVYANYIRVISALHVALFAAAVALADCCPVPVLIIYWLIAIDMTVFTLAGPTPLAPMSTLVIVLAWRFRGPSVTSIPYKAVIGVVYVAALAPVLACGARAEGCDELVENSRVRVAGLITNSALLAVLRF
jgi:hypothetical protein